MDPSKYHQVSGDDPSLRRTQSSSVAKKRSDDNRQTLVGSIAISDLVTQQFAPRLSRQQTFSIGSTPMRSAPRSQIHAVVIPPGSQPSNSLSSKERSKFCPHCGKQYSSPWAVPKHVQRMHDRAGILHCPKCTFKSPSQDQMLQHERTAHRTCPHCKQVFVLLSKHIGTCSKRNKL